MAGCWLYCANLYWITLLPFDVVIQAFIEEDFYIIEIISVPSVLFSFSEMSNSIY